MDIRTVQTHCPAAQAFRANTKCWSSEKYLLHIFEAKPKKHHLAQLVGGLWKPKPTWWSTSAGLSNEGCSYLIVRTSNESRHY